MITHARSRADPKGATMSEYDIGYGRFKPGISGNPQGRSKRKPSHVADIVSDALRAPIQYREGDSVKVATHRELTVKRLVREAIKGNLAAAELLLRARDHAQRYGDVGVDRLQISNWLPDRPGQTGSQKTRERGERREADPTEWWKEPRSAKRRSKRKKP
jgi:Family of unknown function (DUF5681)